MKHSRRSPHTSRLPLAAATLSALALSNVSSAQGVFVIDTFSDAPVELEVFSTGVPPLLSVGGNYDDQNALGGRRAISLVSSFQTVHLVVDDAANELRFDTENGVGQFFLAYGSVSNNGMGVQADPMRRLNADWSEGEAIRLHVSRNDVRMSIVTYAGTIRSDQDPAGAYFGQSNAAELFVDDGFTGDVDIPLSSFVPGFNKGVQWDDIDYLWFSIACRSQGSDFTIEQIELVSGGTHGDLTSDGVVDSADLAILLAAWASMDALSDLDSDGVVGSGDLAILLAAWN